MYRPGGDLLAAIDAGRRATETRDWPGVRCAAELMMASVGQAEAARRVREHWLPGAEPTMRGDGEGI